MGFEMKNKECMECNHFPICKLKEIEIKDTCPYYEPNEK